MKERAPTATQTGDKQIKDRNSEGVEANALGDRPRHISSLRQPGDDNIPFNKGESAHTPLPWKSTGTSMDGWHVREARPFKNRVGLIASTATKADADFIAEACNFYYETAAARDNLRERLLQRDKDYVECFETRNQYKQQRDELLAACKLVQAFLNDLSKSNPGYLGKLVLQNYAQFNEAMIALPKAIKHASETK